MLCHILGIKACNIFEIVVNREYSGGQNWPRPRGPKFKTKEQRRKTLKFFFSETRECKALIFGMKHLLVDFYQDCSYDAPGVKTGPAPGVTILKHRNKEGKL